MVKKISKFVKVAKSKRVWHIGMKPDPQKKENINGNIQNKTFYKILHLILSVIYLSLLNAPDFSQTNEYVYQVPKKWKVGPRSVFALLPAQYSPYDLILVFTCELAGEDSDVNSLVERIFEAVIRE